MDRFFSSLYGKRVPGLAFLALWLISTAQRRCFPICVEQVLRSAAQKGAAQASKPRHTRSQAASKRQVGRPKGRKTSSQTQLSLTRELQPIKGMLQALLQLIGAQVALTYLLLHGHFGTNSAVQMAQQCQLQLICKLRADSAL